MQHGRVLRMLAAAASLLSAGATVSSAQEPASAYPSRNITLIVPQAAGGPPDVIARLVATPLSELLGRPIIVENRAGASASIGAAAVAKATPDGYTLLLGLASVFGSLPNLYEKLPFDLDRDFMPISMIEMIPCALVVNPSMPAKTVAEFVALAKAKPGDLKFASSGIGSPPHLIGLAFLQATGTSMAHVPYRGTAPAVTDIVGGHVEALFVSFATA